MQLAITTLLLYSFCFCFCFRMLCGCLLYYQWCKWVGQYLEFCHREIAEVFSERMRSNCTCIQHGLLKNPFNIGTYYKTGSNHRISNYCSTVTNCAYATLRHKVWSCDHRPLTRYVKLQVAHAPGMFFLPLQVSDPDMHHGTCMTPMSWCMPGSLTRGLLWSRWRGKRSRQSCACATSNFTYLVRGPCIAVLFLIKTWMRWKQ